MAHADNTSISRIVYQKAGGGKGTLALHDEESLHDEAGVIETDLLQDRCVKASKLAEDVHPAGYRIESKEEISPQDLYGGTWEYDSAAHGFAGLHIYTKKD